MPSLLGASSRFNVKMARFSALCPTHFFAWIMVPSLFSVQVMNITLVSKKSDTENSGKKTNRRFRMPLTSVFTKKDTRNIWTNFRGGGANAS